MKVFLVLLNVSTHICVFSSCCMRHLRGLAAQFQVFVNVAGFVQSVRREDGGRERGGDINGGRDCGENPPSAPQQRTGPVWQQPATTDSFCSTLTENHHRQQKEQHHHHQQQQPSPAALRLSILGKCSRCSVSVFRVQKESSLSAVCQFFVFLLSCMHFNKTSYITGAPRRLLACLLGQ